MIGETQKMQRTVFAFLTGPSVEQRRHLMKALKHLWHVLAIVLVPPLLLAVICATTVGLILFVRLQAAGDPFLVRQILLLLVVSTGLILSVIAYTTTVVFGLRKIRVWHEQKLIRKARAATWGLGITALLVLLPFLYLIFLH